MQPDLLLFRPMLELARNGESLGPLALKWRGLLLATARSQVNLLVFIRTEPLTSSDSG